MISVTAITPRSRVVINALKQRPVGEGARKILDGVAVDPTGHRIEDQQQPDGDHDRRQHRRIFDRPDQHALDEHAPRKETMSVIANAAQNGRPAFTSVQAM